MAMLFSVRRGIGFTLLLPIMALGLRADMTPYVGRWQVDIPATMEAAKQDPHDKPAETEAMKKVITSMLGSMVLVIDKDAVGLIRGGKPVESASYTFKDTRDGVTTISVKSNNKAGELSFTAVEPKRIRFKSTLSHAMDSYIWTPDTGTTGAEPSLADMLAGAMGGKSNASTDSGVKKPAASVPTIEANLQTIWEAAGIYSLIYATETVSFDVLVKEKYFFKPFQVSNGEDYSTTVIDVKNRTVSVKDKDGLTHTYKKE